MGNSTGRDTGAPCTIARIIARGVIDSATVFPQAATVRGITFANSYGRKTGPVDFASGQVP